MPGSFKRSLIIIALALAAAIYMQTFLNDKLDEIAEQGGYEDSGASSEQEATSAPEVTVEEK